MDLSAYSLQKLSREKRERQPNWTESEKQLLLLLTRMHRSILENKGSDTMTIKRKSEAWDEIAQRMKAAGYNRSKDRLKQQLGRIRAAEAKKIKDAMERSLTTEEVTNLNNSNGNLIIEDNFNATIPSQINGNENKVQIQQTSIKSTILPTIPVSLQEHHYIKTEKTLSFNETKCFEEELQMNTSSSSTSNVSNDNIMNTCDDNHIEDHNKIVNNIHFKLQNVQSLVDSQQNFDSDVIVHNSINKVIETNITSEITSSIPGSTNTANIKNSATKLKENLISQNENEENAAISDSFSAAASKSQGQQHRLRRIRTKRIRTTFTRQQGLRQLYTYRIAVERERLRSIKMQQKRDRILYLKDIEIQNLKLQILRNLTNQNNDANRFNL